MRISALPIEKLLLGVLLAGLFAGLSGMFASCSRSPKLRPIPADGVVLAFGDSLTRGTGAEEAEAYPAVLARLSGWQVINAGIPGERSAAGLRRLPEALAEHQPALVLLCHGGNDILADAPAAEVAANLDAMIGLCREAGAEVFLLGVPQKGLLLRPAPLYAEVASRNAVPCNVDVIAKVLGKPTLKSDYIHPNAAGYARIAETVWADLRRAQRRVSPGS